MSDEDRAPTGFPSRTSPICYHHLTPAEVWRRQKDQPTYVPEGYEREGFIHLTIGEAELVEVANRYYAGDPRDYVVLVVDPALLSAPVRFVDPRRVYPHLHGPLDRAAVIAVRATRRRPDGVFEAIESEAGG